MYGNEENSSGKWAAMVEKDIAISQDTHDSRLFPARCVHYSVNFCLTLRLILMVIVIKTQFAFYRSIFG